MLYTHKNFQILTDIPADTGNSSNLGYNNVTLVNSDYIDYIMTRVFRITPEKPPVNELLERGFCYNDGYYYYIGGFGVYFATKIVDIKGVYDIGGWCYICWFSVTFITKVIQEHPNTVLQFCKTPKTDIH